MGASYAGRTGSPAPLRSSHGPYVVTDALPTEAASPWRTATLGQRARRRRLLLGVTVLFVVVSAGFGFPTGREVLTGWVLAYLYAACAGQTRVWARVVLRDWLPLIAVLFLYDVLRGAAKNVGAHLARLPTLHLSPFEPAVTGQAHLDEPIAADRALFGGHVPTVWLQDHLYSPGVVHWWDAVAIPIYFSHFVVSLAVAVALWTVSYPVYRRYVWTLVSLTLITVVTYALYPAAPPWMAGLNAALPDVHRIVPEALRALGGHTINSAVERGESYSNRVAAMPSLHGAVPAMLLMFCWPLVRPLARVLLALYVLAMAVTLVYGGEHYVIDILVGWVYAAVCVAGVAAWFRQRQARERPGSARSRGER